MKLKILLLAMLLCPLAVFAELPFGLSFGMAPGEAREIVEANGFVFCVSRILKSETSDYFQGEFLGVPCELMIKSEGSPLRVTGCNMYYDGDVASYMELLCKFVEFLGCSSKDVKIEKIQGGAILASMPLKKSTRPPKKGAYISYKRDKDVSIMIIFDENGPE